MKHILFVLLTLCCIAVADAQTFGYSYGAGRDDVKRQTPIVEPGTERPEDVWAVSGNLQPFGTCANDLDTPPYGPSRAGRRKLPTTDGQKPPDNPNVPQPQPIGDVDVWCGLALLIYVLRIACRKRKQSTAITE